MPRRLSTYWDFGFALLLGGVGALWVPASTIDRVTTELVAFFALQAAAILPGMIFTASILRPDGLSLADISRYRKALREQMLVWVVLLGCDFLATLSIILGKATEWSIAAPVGWLATSRSYSPGLVGVAVFLGSLALLRSVSFVSAVFSLMELNGDLNERAAKSRLADRRTLSQPPPPELLEPPDGYGKVVPYH